MDGYRLRSKHGETIDGQLPLQTDSVEAQETKSVSPTLTYNGKAAIGAVSVASVSLKPIIENLGSRVASFWGEPQNLVYSAFAFDSNKKEASWINSVTETATAAAIVIYDPNRNLEEMFESVTGTVKRFVAKVYDKDGGTLYGWIKGVAASSGVYTFEICNNRLTETQSWVGTLSAFDSTRIEKVEIYFYNSSVSFGTGTAFTEEVACPKAYSKNRQLQLEYAESLADGQYFVDYWRGDFIGVKAAATVSEVLTYNIWASIAGSGGGLAADVNLAQVKGTATAVGAGASDAGTQRVILSSDSPGGTGGGSAGGGNNTYSIAQGDFTAAVTDATNSIVLSVDSIGGSLINANNFANAILKVYDISATTLKTITLDVFTWTSATKTLNTTGATGAFTFNTGDIVSLVLTGPDKMRDSTVDAQKSVEQSPLNQQYTTETLVDTTNVATGTYFPSSSGKALGGTKDVTFSGTLIDGAGETTTLTLEVSNYGGTTATDWQQIYFFDNGNNTVVNSISATNQTTYFAASADNLGSFAYARWAITTSASTNTVKLTTNSKAL